MQEGCGRATSRWHGPVQGCVLPFCRLLPYGLGSALPFAEKQRWSASMALPSHVWREAIMVSIPRMEAWRTCRSTGQYLTVSSGLCDCSWKVVSVGTVPAYNFPFQFWSEGRKIWRKVDYQTTELCFADTQLLLFWAELKWHLLLQSHLEREAAGS